MAIFYYNVLKYSECVSMSKTIAIFTEPAAIGPLMNCIGIAQGLEALGHKPVFLIDPAIAGKAQEYGFEEVQVPCMEPMPAEQAEKYWEDFIRDSIPTFKTSAYDQISTYVKECWLAIMDTVYWGQKSLPAALEQVKPDIILSDNVACRIIFIHMGWILVIGSVETSTYDIYLAIVRCDCNTTYVYW